MTDYSNFYPPIDAPNLGSVEDPRLQRNRGELLSYGDVIERLVEAWGFLRRMPDREAGWVRSGQVSSLYRLCQLTPREAWSLYRIDSDDYDRDAQPRQPGLRAAEVDRMNETLAWVEWVPERDRKLVGVALSRLERGDATVPWIALAPVLALGVGPDALRMRFDRAITRIAARLAAGAKPRPLV